MPYGDTIIYSEHGHEVTSQAHGIRVYQTIDMDNTAKEAVDSYYERLKNNPEIALDANITQETMYDETLDIAIKMVGYTTDKGTLPRVSFLYADQKEGDFYLFAEITYMLEQTYEQHEDLLKELSYVFNFDLPVLPPLEQ